jgi:NADPH-dependent 2,4-dienoyl-CoA reductase/sulfur reductase-like enzyme
MISHCEPPPLRCDVAIIGGGPSGLAAATELKNLGVASVVVLEREPQAGGIPRHRGHPPFGMREFNRIYTGPRYARRLVERAQRAAVTLCLDTSVVSLAPGGVLQLTTPLGLHELRATRVIICTGIRETPRAPRLVSGQRPLGISTTGALQSMVYLQNKTPFKNPIILGSELVSFSALLTCRHAKIRPAAMLERNPRITARTGAQLLPGALGVPLHLNTALLEILGRKRISGVTVQNRITGQIKLLECDGLVFSGQFVAESSLMRNSHLQTDPQTGNPVIDQYGRCSDPDYFATGNMTHPVETAGYCWNDGVHTARHVYASISGLLGSDDKRISIVVTAPQIKYITPQLLAFPGENTAQQGMKKIQMRFNIPSSGRLSIQAQSGELFAKSVHALPERRVELPLPEFSKLNLTTSLEIKFEAA